LVAEGDKPRAWRKVIDEAGFTGRSDELITLLNKDPRKLTLVGLGKPEKLSVRGLRAALYSAAKTAKKHRDRAIGVVFPYLLPSLSAEETTRVAADFLGQADYKYDAYITTNKDEKPPAITGTLIPPDGIDGKRLRQIESEARAIAGGIRTVRDLGNAPSNIITPSKIAERAQQVAKSVGVKCTVHDKRDIEKMKMGGLLAVNRGSAEEPRFIVLEYAPKKATKHVALVGKGITF